LHAGIGNQRNEVFCARGKGRPVAAAEIPTPNVIMMIKIMVIIILKMTSAPKKYKTLGVELG